MSTNNSQQTANEPEINLKNVLEFLDSRWRWLLLGAFLGPLLAFGYIKAVSPFKAEAIVENVCKDKDKDCPVDFFLWRSLSERLPAIAGQWFVSPEFKSLHQGDNRDWMLSVMWWRKNVVPQYAFQKEDSKNFPNADDRIKSASTQIIAFKMSAQGGTHEVALMRLDQLFIFFRDVLAYMRFKALIDDYRVEFIAGAADNAAAKAKAEIELSYQKAKSEGIKRIFTSEIAYEKVDQVKIDISNSEVSYLPLKTQLNASEIILMNIKATISRLNDDAAKFEVLTRFVGQADGVIGEKFNGVSASELSNRLFMIESEVRARLAEDNKIGISTINRVKADLTHAELSSSFLLMVSRQVIEPLITLKEIVAASLGGGVLAIMGSFLAMKHREATKWRRR